MWKEAVVAQFEEADFAWRGWKKKMETLRTVRCPVPEFNREPPELKPETLSFKPT
jgi:hypothetical protein